MSDAIQRRTELSAADTKNATSEQQQLWKVTAAFKQQNGTTRFVEYATAPPPDIVPPAAPTGPIGYYDDDSTRRTAKELPHLLRIAAALQGSSEGKQRVPAHAAATTHAPTAPLLSGTARAREEIFMRRAQLVAELNGLGMPSMIDWSTPGGHL